MKTFALNSQQIEFDETLVYADFFLSNNEPQALSFDMDAILSKMESGELEFDEMQWRMWSRWVNEAPRKRRYREQILGGDNVPLLSTEYFFHDSEHGAQFIDALENTGKLAADVCRIYGLEPVGPIKQDDPFRPTTIQEVLE